MRLPIEADNRIPFVVDTEAIDVCISPNLAVNSHDISRFDKLQDRCPSESQGVFLRSINRNTQQHERLIPDT